MSELPVMSEVVFDVTKETDGGYDAESTTENLSAQGDTWEDLSTCEKRFSR
jgi:hypothetical protein